MDVIGGIVTYNPDIPLLRDCLEALLIVCNEIIIIDNGSKNIEEIVALASDNVSIIENEINCGVAKALNQVFRKAKEQGYEWVLTLDQDTVVPNNILIEAEKLIKLDEHIAVVCSRIHDVISGDTWPEIDDSNQIMYVNRCITSGSINRVSAWQKIGGFDEILFIDEVDHDFCYRLNNAGYKIALANNVIIHHRIGETQIRTIFGKKIYIRNHSAFRKYYICRNIIYLSKKYFGKIRINALLHVFAFMGKTVLFEQDKSKKIIACLRGIRDGIRG